jgi:hypothetical protein
VLRRAHIKVSLVAATRESAFRNADLDRFTVDRLMSIINRLGSRIDVKSGSSRCRRGKRTRKAEAIVDASTAPSGQHAAPDGKPLEGRGTKSEPRPRSD